MDVVIIFASILITEENQQINNQIIRLSDVKAFRALKIQEIEFNFMHRQFLANFAIKNVYSNPRLLSWRPVHNVHVKQNM